MPLDLRHDAAYHTNGRLGMFFSQTEIEVWEVKELSGTVSVEEIPGTGSRACSDALSGTVTVEPQVGP